MMFKRFRTSRFPALSYGAPRRFGFTLVELLVVIAIIATLVGLLLPAVNAAREASKKLQCANNLTQLSKGCLSYESEWGTFPSNGWGYAWVGDPDRGYGLNQPGGWMYNILPYVDQRVLHDVGRAPSSQSDKIAAARDLVQSPLAFTLCPTRGRAALGPFSVSGNLANNYGGVSAVSGQKVARSDYAINVGDYQATNVTQSNELGAGPSSDPGTIADIFFNGATFTNSSGTLTSSGGTLNLRLQSTSGSLTTIGAPAGFGDHRNCTGVSYSLSRIRTTEIGDGLTCTLLLGEKYMPPSAYTNGQSTLHCENMYAGMSVDNGRCTFSPPMKDRPDVTDAQRFGGPHYDSLNISLCDGSVRSITYSIDTTVWKNIGNRKDGTTIDMSRY